MPFAPLAADSLAMGPGRPAFEAMVENLPDPVLVVSAHEALDLADRRLVFANTAARDLLRIQGEGAPLVSAIRHPRVLEAVDESLFGGLHGEAAYETGGAQDRFWRVLTRPLAAAEDGAKMALLVIRDETDSRRTERMRADFLANASHELRTPLASLTGFIETLRGHAKDDAVARERFLGVMAAQAGRMARLIDDLLSLSRIEQKQHVRPSAAVDLSQAARHVRDTRAPLAKELGVEIRLSAEQPVLVTGDRDELVRVAENLIENAIKYGARDGAADGNRVEVTVSRTPKEGTLAVRDFGRGIQPEHLPRLTERFYRIDPGQSRAKNGTGLGLAIVKHILARHRGRLTISSRPEHGSTFTAIVPLHDR